MCSSTIWWDFRELLWMDVVVSREGKWEKVTPPPLKKLVGFLVGLLSLLTNSGRASGLCRGAHVTIRQLPCPIRGGQPKPPKNIPSLTVHKALKTSMPGSSIKGWKPPWGDFYFFYIDFKGPAEQFRLHRLLCAPPQDARLFVTHSKNSKCFQCVFLLVLCVCVCVSNFSAF